MCLVNELNYILTILLTYSASKKYYKFNMFTNSVKIECIRMNKLVCMFKQMRS